MKEDHRAAPRRVKRRLVVAADRGDIELADHGKRAVPSWYREHVRRAPTVSVRALLPLAQACPPAKRARFWRDLGLDAAVRADPDARVAAPLLFRAFELAEAACGDPYVGLHIAEHGPPGRLDVLLHLAANSPTIRDAILRICAYVRLINEAAELSLEVHGRDAAMVFVPRGIVVAPPAAGLRAYFEISTGTCARQLRLALGEPNAPIEARFAVPPPADVAPVERFFRGPVAYGRTRTEVRFPATWLAMRPRGANPDVGQVLERYARALAARLPADDATTAERVRIELARLPGPSAASIEMIARALGVSTRTLQRTLAAEGTTFRRVCDEVAAVVARRHLEERKLSIAEVALLLGFDDVSAFSRAFRRWTGTSPARFRAASV